MPESDPANPKVTANGTEPVWRWAFREMKGVGVAAVVLAFGMYEWHTIVKELQATMVEVSVLMKDVRTELREHRFKTNQ
jgi:hypothetical protein